MRPSLLPSEARVVDFLAAHPSASAIEIADSLGMTEGTVRVHISHARKKLAGKARIACEPRYSITFLGQ